MRSAVVDLGSNTFHALVADVDAVGVRNALVDRKLAVRIGEHAFAAGHIPAEAYARGLDALGELLAITRPRAGASCRVVATGVFREATNAREWLDAASARHGIAIDLLSSVDEARLTWVGVSAELAGSHGRLAVLDLGGGSLELAHGVERVDVAHGLPLGALRARELRNGAARAAVLACGAEAFADLRGRGTDTIAVASGTARALLRLGKKLGLVASAQRHVGRRQFAELARVLGPMAPKAIAALGVEPARADTIAAGAAILDAALELLGSPVVYVARSALREGALVEQARLARSAAA